MKKQCAVCAKLKTENGRLKLLAHNLQQKLDAALSKAKYAKEWQQLCESASERADRLAKDYDRQTRELEHARKLKRRAA